MSTATQSEPRIASVKVTRMAIVAHLVDGRTVSVPLEWSWRLSDATPKQRARWEIIGDGQGIHWPDVDEDISLDGCCAVFQPNGQVGPWAGRATEGSESSFEKQPVRGSCIVLMGEDFPRLTSCYVL